MNEVFISFDEDARTLAKELASRLAEIEIIVSIDCRDGIGGEIERVAHVLLLITPGWVKSSWREFEHYFATSMTTPVGFVAKLLPLVILDDGAPPVLLKPLVESDFILSAGKAPEIDYVAIIDYIRAVTSPPAQGPDASPLRQLFVLGHPGSGKSAFCNLFRDRLGQRGVVAGKVDVYTYLQVLFRIDQIRQDLTRFEADPISEFLVKNPAVYGEALALVRDRLIMQEAMPGRFDVVELPFSYEEDSFLTETLKSLPNSAIVHVDAPLAVCEARNRSRGETLQQLERDAATARERFDLDSDVHYVPAEFFERYRIGAEHVEKQVRALPAMPGRGYFRISNAGSDLSQYQAACDRLMEDFLLPLLLAEKP